MENEEIVKKAKEIWDSLDLIDLSQDIIDGNNLLIRRIQFPRYVILPNGCYDWNIEYKMNENNIMQYINKIISKYKVYIDLNNVVVRFRQGAFQNTNIENVPKVCNIESYIGLLMQILQAKLMKKTVEEIFK